MKKILFFITSLFLSSILFISCSSNKPTDQEINNFVGDKFPPLRQVLSNVWCKVNDVKIINKWSDENNKGIFFIDVEAEEHYFSGREGSNVENLEDTRDSYRKLFTYRFIKKGDIWDADEYPVETKTIWQHGYNWGECEYDVLSSTNGGGIWKSCIKENNLGVFDALTINSTGYIFAANAGYASGEHLGLYRSIDSGGTWSICKINEENEVDFRAFSFDSKGNIYAAGGSGVVFSKDNGNSWIKIQMPNNIMPQAIEIAKNGNIIVGQNRIYVRRSNSDTWEKAGLWNLNINEIKKDHNGTLYACTNKGVYSSNDNGYSWKDTYLGHYVNGVWLNDLWVNSLTVDKNNNVWAATEEAGIFCLKNNYAGWTQNGITNNYNMVRCITFDNDGNIFIGAAKCCPVESFQLLKSSDNGNSWTKLFSLDKERAISNIVVNKQGSIFIGLTRLGE